VKKHLQSAHSWCNKYEWIIFLVGIVILARIPTLFTPHYYGDEEIYFVMGRAWREGVPMYEAMFDHKPPLIYILAGIAQNVFWFRLMLMATMVAHTVLFVKLAKKFWASTRPKLAYLSSLIFVVLLTIPTFEGNIANAELFMMLPLTASLLMLWNAEKADWKRYLAAGLVAGVGWLFKVPVAADFAAIVLYLFVFREKNILGSIRSVFSRSFLAVTAGFVLPLAATFAYYYFKGHFGSYLETVLTVNLGYVSSWSTSEYAFNPFKSGLMVRGMVVAAITLFLYIFRKKLDKRLVLATLWLIFAFFGALLSGRPYPHYLHEPFVPLSLFLPFIFVAESVIAWIVIGMVILWAVVTNNQIKFWGYNTWPIYTNFAKAATKQITKEEYFDTFDGARRNYEIGNYLNERMQPDDKIYVWGSDAAIYNITGKLPSGGKYIVDFHVRDFRKFDYVMENLAESKPRFVVVHPNAAEFPALEELLDNNYIQILESDGSIVYKRLVE
jgi:hypothetical protein